MSRRIPSCVARLAPAILAGLVLGAWNIAEARALELRVRAQSRLLAEVQAAGTSVQAWGQLRDELDGPLVQRRVTLTLRPEGSSEVDWIVDTTHSDMRGEFRFAQELAPGTYDVRLSLAGSDEVVGTFEERRIVVRASPLKLQMECPPTVGRLRAGEAVICQARASVDGLGVSAALDWEVDAKAVGSSSTDHLGRAEADVTAVLAPGPGTVQARVAPTVHREAAMAQALLRRLENPVSDVTTEFVYRRRQRGVLVQGTTADVHGPIEDLEVVVTLTPATDAASGTLARPDQRPGSPGMRLPEARHIRTGPDGAFRVFIPIEDLQKGLWVARASHRPALGEPWDATSPAVAVRASAGWPYGLLVALAFVGMALILFGNYLARAPEALQDLLGRWRKRSPRPAAPLAEGPSSVPGGAPPPRQGAGHRLLGPTGRIELEIWDSWRTRPVSGARLTLEHSPSRTRLAESQSAASGLVAMESREVGAFCLRVEAPGFVELLVPMTLPHTGAWTGRRLELVPRALALRRQYQRIAARVRGTDVWGQKTPREFVAGLTHGTIPDPALGELPEWEALALTEALADVALWREAARLVERAYFSPDDVDDDAWRETSQVLAELEQALGLVATQEPV